MLAKTIWFVNQMCPQIPECFHNTVFNREIPNSPCSLHSYIFTRACNTINLFLPRQTINASLPRIRASHFDRLLHLHIHIHLQLPLGPLCYVLSSFSFPLLSPQSTLAFLLLSDSSLYGADDSPLGPGNQWPQWNMSPQGGGCCSSITLWPF